MKKMRMKRLIAGFLAFVLVLTSGCLYLFRDSVFGASNKNSNPNPNPYVNEAGAQLVKVVKRGDKKNKTADIVYTDEGSNIQGKTPKNKYQSWMPNEDGSITTLPTDFVVPGTNGAKGTDENPFIILEIVPDKVMQELVYFTGSEESGYPVDPAVASAKVMVGLRNRATDNYIKNLRFTDTYYGNVQKQSWMSDEYYENEIKSRYNAFYEKMYTHLYNTYGHWLNDTQYDAFIVGQTDEKGNPKTKQVRMFDCKNYSTGDDKKGQYNFNELYNVEFSTDDLLDTYPTAREGDSAYSYSEVNHASYREYKNNKGTLIKEHFWEGDPKTMYYTEDLIALARASTYKDSDYDDDDDDSDDKEPSKEDIEDFIKKTLTNVHLDVDLVKSTNRPTGNKNSTKGGGTTETKHTSDIVKYNLALYSQNEGACKTRLMCDFNYSDEEATEKAHKLSQDITEVDYETSGDVDKYDIPQGLVCRGRNSNTKHVGLNITNYWKVQFRKYYVDHFEELYKDYLNKEIAWKNSAGGTQNALDNNQEQLLHARNKALRKLLLQYEPLFTRQGVNAGTFIDAYDWDVQEDNVLSENRTYYATNATNNKGGYIMAMKPGKGDMYLLTEDEVKKIGGSKGDIVFTREDKDLNGKTRPASAKRWKYIDGSFALNGYQEPDENITYHSGYLDDNRYTNGFASKSFVDSGNYWLAVYDRKNRKYHADSADAISYKMLDITNKLSDQNGYKWTDRDKNLYFYLNGDTNRKYTDTHLIQLYNDFSNLSDGRDEASATDNRFPIDDFHLNVLDSLKQDLNLTNDQINNNVKKFDNLINGESGGWNGYLYGTSGTSKKMKNFMYIDSDETASEKEKKAITGFTLNFNPVDVYNFDTVFNINNPNNWSNSRGDKNQIKAARDWRQGIEVDRYKPTGARYTTPYNDKGEETDEKKKANKKDVSNESNDRVATVDTNINKETGKRNVLVCEAGKKYTFTYYGFKQNDIVKDSLFTFFGNDAQEKHDNFKYKVICLTASEVNQINRKAQEHNEQYGTAINSGVYLDLIERADMFFIHSQRSKSENLKIDQGMKEAYWFYNDVCDSSLLADGKSSGDIYNNNTLFYDCDLEWSSVMKLLKRNSTSRGQTLPILFNNMVHVMTEETVEPKSNSTSSNADDNRMYLNSTKTGEKYAGNVCNIAKLEDILLQFNLRAVKGTCINPTDKDGNPTPDSEKKYIKRAFMKDIYKYIKTVPINENFVGNVGRVDGTAQTTGYVDALTADTGEKEYARKLSSATDVSDQFKRNALYLWNKWTFYPYDKTFDDTRLSFLQQGYQESYWRGVYKYEKNSDGVWVNPQLDENGQYKNDTDHRGAVLPEVGGNDGNYIYRLGTDGYDDQNTFVMHQPEDDAGKTGASLLVDYGQYGRHALNFFWMTYQIMGRSNDVSDLEIDVKERRTAYSLMGKSTREVGKPAEATPTPTPTPDPNAANPVVDDDDEDDVDDDDDVGADNNTDIIMMDYVRDKNMYRASVLENLIKKEKNILCLGRNHNNESAVITGAYLAKLSDGRDATTGEYKVGKELDLKDFLKEDGVTKFGNDVETVKTSDESDNAVGIEVEPEESLFFYIPYTMADFFNDYDLIVLKGVCWNTKQNRSSTNKIQKKEWTHFVDVNERRIFNLE